MARQRRSRTRGSILIVVSWTVFLLGALAVAVGMLVDTNLTEALRNKDELAADACTASAVARILVYAFADTNEWDGAAEDWRTEEGLFAGEIAGAAFVITSGVSRVDGQREGVTGLCDEDGKVNLALADGSVLHSLFQNVGGVSDAEAEDLTAALQRATAAERSGHAYVLDVIIDRRGSGADASWNEKFLPQFGS